MRPGIVIDTNVIVSALRSKRGASHLLLSLVDEGLFDISISVPLVLEYEATAKRLAPELGLVDEDIDVVLDYLCRVSSHRKIFYLWRPYLRDAKDDLVLELAVEAGAECIVTFNKRDFEGAQRFGIRVVTPWEFLKRIGRLP